MGSGSVGQDQGMSINQFWEHARVGANLNPFAEWIGPSVRGTVPPPAWAFGDSPELADRLAADVRLSPPAWTTEVIRSASTWR